MKYRYFAVVLVLLLSACGQRGPLYMPEPEAQVENTTEQPSEDSTQAVPERTLEPK